MAEMTKMTGESRDLVAERIAALKTLVPEAFAEGKIDFDALKGALGDAVDSSSEHYRFTWNGKEEARAFALRPSMGTLRPCAQESAGQDGTPGKFDSENLYIEGDNLEVLKLLQGAYHNAVKMIYIDPPYNTGHDFVYADDFSDSLKNYKKQTGQVDGEGRATHANAETSGRYHTDWLNMMFPRLLLARNLLREDGVIFISIDDNEVTNLRKLCDEVFGEMNFVAQVVWEKMYTTKNDSSFISNSHEYVLVYCKSILTCEFGTLDRTAEMDARYTNPDNDLRGPWKAVPLYARGESKNGRYAIVSPVTGASHFPPTDTHWRYAKETLDAMLADNRIWFGKNGDAYPNSKRFLSEIGQGVTAKSLWSHDEVGSNDSANRGMRALFTEGDVFSFPKPPTLIARMVKLGVGSGDIVLDFFSGSGTTAHAVMQLNAEDGGHRKFIMVQLPEKCEEGSEAAKAGFKNICEIGKERIRRAGKKINEELRMKNDELPLEGMKQCRDVGFKVFKLDTSNLIPWNPNPENLEASLLAAVENCLPDRSVDDLLYEILLKCNLPLTLPVEKREFGANTISVVGAGALMICLDQTITAAVAEEMVRLRDEVYKPTTPMQVVFRDGGFTDNEKANAIATLIQAGVEERAILSI